MLKIVKKGKKNRFKREKGKKIQIKNNCFIEEKMQFQKNFCGHLVDH